VRKGQGALEYLMTYGWAILVVVIVGLVLWRSGVFGTSSTGSSGFDVLVPAEWTITNRTNASQILFRNVAGQALRNVNITYYDGTSRSEILDNGFTIGAGQQKLVNLSTVTCTPGGSVTLNVNVTYTSEGGLTHTDSGIIYADCEA